MAAFQHRIEPFGKTYIHHLEDENGYCMSVVPEYGGCLLDLTMEGIPVLDGYLTPDELLQNRWSKNVLLFPFPNRLEAGSYQWGEDTYQFPINDPANGNALHGFSSWCNFTVEGVRTGNAAGLHLRYVYKQDETYYPFTFEMDVFYRLKTTGGFSLTVRLKNTGDRTLPFGIGWHPYFQAAKNLEQVKIKLPPCSLIGVDRKMIPTGKRYTYDLFQDFHPLRATVLDNCFALQDTDAQAEMHLLGNRCHLRIWQESGPGKFPFFQLFTHPDRKSIAVEPMSCNINAFNNGEGLQSLEPDQEWKLTCGVEMV